MTGDKAAQLARARLADIVRRAARGETGFTRFLTDADELLGLARREGVRALLWGGYEGAERFIACAAPPGSEDVDWPIAALEISWDARYASAGHRDILGGVLALGIERDCVGDILPGDGRAVVFAHESVARHIRASLESCGRARVTVRELSGGELPEGKPLRERQVTVASPRLDAVLAEARNLSRAKAAELIAGGRVLVNHREEQRVDARLAEGDILSVRGHGRVKICAYLGENKKGRIRLTVGVSE